MIIIIFIYLPVTRMFNKPIKLWRTDRRTVSRRTNVSVSVSGYFVLLVESFRAGGAAVLQFKNKTC